MIRRRPFHRSLQHPLRRPAPRRLDFFALARLLLLLSGASCLLGGLTVVAWVWFTVYAPWPQPTPLAKKTSPPTTTVWQEELVDPLADPSAFIVSQEQGIRTTDTLWVHDSAEHHHLHEGISLKKGDVFKFFVPNRNSAKRTLWFDFLPNTKGYLEVKFDQIDRIFKFKAQHQRESIRLTLSNDTANDTLLEIKVLSGNGFLIAPRIVQERIHSLGKNFIIVQGPPEVVARASEAKISEEIFFREFILSRGLAEMAAEPSWLQARLNLGENQTLFQILRRYGYRTALFATPLDVAMSQDKSPPFWGAQDLYLFGPGQAPSSLKDFGAWLSLVDRTRFFAYLNWHHTSTKGFQVGLTHLWKFLRQKGLDQTNTQVFALSAPGALKNVAEDGSLTPWIFGDAKSLELKFLAQSGIPQENNDAVYGVAKNICVFKYRWSSPGAVSLPGQPSFPWQPLDEPYGIHTHAGEVSWYQDRQDQDVQSLRNSGVIYMKDAAQLLGGRMMRTDLGQKILWGPARVDVLGTEILFLDFLHRSLFNDIFFGLPQKSGDVLGNPPQRQNAGAVFNIEPFFCDFVGELPFWTD